MKMSFSDYDNHRQLIRIKTELVATEEETDTIKMYSVLITGMEI